MPADLVKAESLWIHVVQDTLISDTKFILWQKQFNLFQDEHGLRRRSGQLAHANLPYDTNH